MLYHLDESCKSLLPAYIQSLNCVLISRFEKRLYPVPDGKDMLVVMKVMMACYDFTQALKN